MNDLSNKKVRDSVYDALGGEWKVVQIDNDDVFSLKVKSGDIEPKEAWITPDGEGEALVPAFFSEPVRVIPAQGECDFSGYQVDDEVYDEKGRPYEITGFTDNNLPEVRGANLNWGRLTLDGKLGGKQIFFHAPPNLVASNPDAFRIPQHIAERKKSVDWANVPIDTLVEVHVKGEWKTRYYAGWKSGTPTYFCYGATSHTADELAWATVQLSKIRLANEENTK